MSRSTQYFVPNLSLCRTIADKSVMKWIAHDRIPGFALLALSFLCSCSGDEVLNGSWTFSSASCNGTDITTTYKDSATAITMNIAETSSTSTSGTEVAQFGGCNRNATLAFDTISASTLNVTRSTEVCGSTCAAKCTNPTNAIATTYAIDGSSMTWTQTSTAAYCSNQSLSIIWTK